jgi:Uma2 family endonuclease
MPPAGFETGYRSNDLSRQLGNWAIADGRGVAFDSSTEYLPANTATRSPDASWILKSRFASLTKQQKKRFVHLCPDFVVEIGSPSDRPPELKAKMEEWIENGAQLAWLIDADLRVVCIYRPGRPAEELAGARPHCRRGSGGRIPARTRCNLGRRLDLLLQYALHHAGSASRAT